MAAPAASRRFGMEDFLWGSTLGEGSYARVVHAQLRANGRHYAIKVHIHVTMEACSLWTADVNGSPSV